MKKAENASSDSGETAHYVRGMLLTTAEKHVKPA